MISIRNQFPILQRQIECRPIVYLDSAATYLKPRGVIDAVSDCYGNIAGTVGRGLHVLAEEASAMYDEARQTIASFINADADEIIFVRNATEAINLVAANLSSSAKVIGSIGEHHSNLLPWRNRNRFRAIALESDGQIDRDDLRRSFTESNPTLAAFSTIGNAFGVVHPTREIVSLAHSVGCDVLLDANQSVAHQTIDVREIDCEYLCFSGHKLGGPTGIGVLYAKRDRLDRITPRLWGGGMVDSVDLTGFELADVPQRFEAGTPAFEATIGLAAACDFISQIGFDEIQKHEKQLTAKLIESLSSIDKINVVGPKSIEQRGSIVAFQVEGLEAHGVARMLSNRSNICVRSGFHCAQMAHSSIATRPTIRASFGVYNTLDEINVFTETMQSICDYLH